MVPWEAVISLSLHRGAELFKDIEVSVSEKVHESLVESAA